MSRSDVEMKRVLKHLGDKLAGALAAERKATYPITQVLVALAYAQGVVDLLSAYLVVTDDETGDLDAGGEPS